ncbi:DEAD/DEAH box helicase [Pedobacter soli]|uniref:Superfamily II DNA or RNA helicase n=1 Tax=Pedobacter soli TaxID=390242 RepID=A0A1G6JY74_9SPHI|nr:DEAD/DEAH box helicase family protein [Pedobacter soli]SDC23653.1 Superfamily II DNA or RNA helicase [Pedobacter soli]
MTATQFLELVKNFKTGTGIRLPRIESGAFKQNIGKINHIIKNERYGEIIAIEQIPISPRISENAIVLRDGIKILVSQRKKIAMPEEVSEVLSFDSEGKLFWDQHVLINEFRSRVVQIGLEKIAGEIAATWHDIFSFKAEKKNSSGEITDFGFRPPQLGALHAIGSHWSLYHSAGTLVMPTGTGKTETMLATMVAYNPGKILVVVPSRALRAQTFEKFLTLGLLRKLGNIGFDSLNPIVGVVTSIPKSDEDLTIFDKCNVIIASMGALNEDIHFQSSKKIASKVDALIIDEAHHIAAPTWTAFKEFFQEKKVLQFTATPYRRDGKLVDGKVLYEYALQQAQVDGYFKKINFYPVHQIDDLLSDSDIANEAVQILKQDLTAELDHILMARCADTTRAGKVVEIYRQLAPELNPVLVHSVEKGSEASLRKIFSRESRIVVCVNMLGEGFDLPQLKIAAVHDIHKSLAILLQFTGRFTRTSASKIGEASIVANIARAEVSLALERLYSEDADWNILLSEMSSQAARSHAELMKFLNESKQLEGGQDGVDAQEISHHLLKPTFNTMIYECEKFEPKRFHEGVPDNMSVQRVWLNDESKTIYFVTRVDFPLKWTRSKTIRDTEWHLFVIHYDQERKLIYFSSTEKTNFYDKMVSAVGATRQIREEQIFRTLGRINRLIFQNIGVKKNGRRNLRFAMYVGGDVVQALALTEKTGSSKSNLSGTGWENGAPVTIGCSAKGRVWARDPGSIPELIQWCENVGDKLLDESIDPSKIIDNVLIPEEVEILPAIRTLSIDWPMELLRKSQERVNIYDSHGKDFTLSLIDIDVAAMRKSVNEIVFTLSYNQESVWATFVLTVGGKDGFLVGEQGGDKLKIKMGRKDLFLSEYFSNYPPLIRYIDLSELDGNLLIKPQNPREFELPEQIFEPWDWRGVDISKESLWKEGNIRNDSIQWRVSQAYIAAGYEIVFDDDAAGESADLVCLREEADFIRLALVHCKFTKGKEPGERVNDVVEVCSQAIRSTKWKWKFKDLCTHILGRETRLASAIRQSRFLTGNANLVNRVSQVSRFKEIKLEIIIVQPGISKANISPDQKIVLAASHSFLQETVGIELQIICSD